MLIFNQLQIIIKLCVRVALYFFKSESEISNALCQAERKIKTQKIKLREATCKIVHAFANTGQDSVQEVTHLCLPEL